MTSLEYIGVYSKSLIKESTFKKPKGMNYSLQQDEKG